MNSKQIGILAAVLVLLGGLAAWLHFGGSGNWKQADTKSGSQVLPGLVVNSVASLRINAGKDQVTLERKGEAWSIKERDGYPADAQKIGPFLLKLAGLKIVQTDTITDALRPRLQLAPPGQTDGGTAVDMLDAGGKSLGSLIIGKALTKKSEIPGATQETPTGRYLLVREQPTVAIAVNDPLSEIDASPKAWLDKNFAKPERIKSITLASDGKPRWRVLRAEEAGLAWQLQDAAKTEEFDSSKPQELTAGLGNLAMVDIAVGPKPDELGLTNGDVLTVETFDGLSYVYTIGKKNGENRAVTVTVTGTPAPAPERTPGKDEKAEDKAKFDKEYKEAQTARTARIAREQAMDKKVFLMADASVAPLLKERAALIKPKAEPVKGKGDNNDFKAPAVKK
jgi:hypothetical protein